MALVRLARPWVGMVAIIVHADKAAYDAVIAHPETFPDRIGSDDARDFRGDIADLYFERFDEEVIEADLREP